MSVRKDKELDGKVAIVTGGAVRLGKALALALARHGLRLAIHYSSSADAAQKTVNRIVNMGGDAISIQADLREAAAATSIIERAVEHFGHIDILVNNAAIFQPGDWATTTEVNWDEHFAINLKAPFFLSQAFAAHVGHERRGHIVNLADWPGIRPGADHLAYTLTKAGVIAMTKAWHWRWRPMFKSTPSPLARYCRRRVTTKSILNNWRGTFHLKGQGHPLK